MKTTLSLGDGILSRFLDGARGGEPRNTSFVVIPRKLGLPAGPSYDCVSGLLDHLEGTRLEEPRSGVIFLDSNILGDA